MSISIQAAIKCDEDYLRDDMRRVNDFLVGTIDIYTVCGARRMGKTSFLEFVRRRAEELGRVPVWVSFEPGIAAAAYREISNVIGIEASTPDELSEALSRSTKDNLVLLVDEAYSLLHDEEVVQILRVLAFAAKSQDNIRLCIADVPAFYESCLERRALDNYVLDKPYRLPPVTGARRQEYLGELSGPFSDLADRIGSLPIELRILKRLELDSEEIVALDSEELADRYYSDAILPYQAMFQSVGDRAKSLLRLAAAQRVPVANLQEGRNNPALGILGERDGFGLARRDATGNVVLTSQVFADVVRNTETPHQDDADRILAAPERNTAALPVGPRLTVDKELIIHHLSDLHFGRFGAYDDRGRHLSNEYISFLRVLPESSRPHVIVISGDLTSTGSQSEMLEASQFIGAIKTGKGQDHRSLVRPFAEGGSVEWGKQLVVVPGNHDVAWPDGVDGSPSFDAFQGSDIIAKAVNPFDPQPAVHYRRPHVSVLALNSARHNGFEVPLSVPSTVSPEMREKYGLICKLIRDGYSEVMRFTSTIDNAMPADDRAFMLGNTVRFSSGYVDPADLEEVAEHYRSCEQFGALAVGTDSEYLDPWPAPIRIAVCHHNLFNYHDAALFTDLINSGEVRTALRGADVSILLYGHKHSALVSTEVDNATGRPFHTIGAGQLGALNIYEGRGGGDPLANTSFNEIIVDCGYDAESVESGERTVTVKPYVLFQHSEEKYRFQPVGGRHTVELKVRV